MNNHPISPKVGDKLRDNNPQKPDRVLDVVSVWTGYVKARTPAGRLVWIQLQRIYSDGKSHRSGFTLMPKVDAK